MQYTPIVLAYLENDESVLLSRRRDGTPLAGRWEFPGGKVDAGETLPEALRRELREELGITAHVHDEIAVTHYHYTHGDVELHLFRCTLISGVPVPLQVAEVRWVPKNVLASVDFPPANAALFDALACYQAPQEGGGHPAGETMIKGMLLAAGRGTRLGPLTEYWPKPLLPVANRPVMRQGIACLRALGITEIGVNVSYRAEIIRAAFGDGEAQGATLRWLVEDEPSGTAGGLKVMQTCLAHARVVVVAGDAMLDVDLRPLLAAHIARGAFATLATINVTDPSLYGVVVTDEEGHILRFQEKPDPGTEISHQANTGIYIFEPGIFDLIPAGAFCDFARHVFPEILRRGLPFHALPVAGYWTDIGNPRDYLQANLDFLAGRMHVEDVGQCTNGCLLAETAQVAGTTLRDCIVGDRSVIAPGSTLTRCVVWPDTILHTQVSLTDTVLTPHGFYAIVGREAHLLPSRYC